MGNGRLEHRQDFWARLIAATFLMRAAVAAVSLALCWILHVIPAAERPAFSILVLFVYLPFGAAMLAVRRRWSGDTLARVMVTGDLLIVFVVELLVPSVAVVALLCYILFP